MWCAGQSLLRLEGKESAQIFVFLNCVGHYSQMSPFQFFLMIDLALTWKGGESFWWLSIRHPIESKCLNIIVKMHTLLEACWSDRLSRVSVNCQGSGCCYLSSANWTLRFNEETDRGYHSTDSSIPQEVHSSVSVLEVYRLSPHGENNCREAVVWIRANW